MYKVNPNKIKGLMADRGKVQADIAKALSISTVSTSFKLTGKRDFKFEELCALAEYFGVDLDYFFNRVVDKIETK